MDLPSLHGEVVLLRTTYAAGVETQNQDEGSFHGEDHHIYNVPTGCELLAADL